MNISKILVSKKELYGNKDAFKYFIGYNGNDKIRPLCIRLPQMNGYIRRFEDGNKTMPLKVTDKQLLDSYIKIWKRLAL